MSELPGHPNLDQLRRQARELLRAAADGEPSALTRIRTVSERVSLSAAQLAVAREYGFASWPALHAEVERRLAELSSRGAGTGQGGTRWSFGGADAIDTAAGMLYVGAVIAGPVRASLDATLIPSRQSEGRLGVLPRGDEGARAARARATIALAEAAIATAMLTDDQGTTYALRIVGMTGGPGFQGEMDEPVSLDLVVEPVPARERGWLELRGQRGSATRLLPSPRPDVRVSRLGPIPEGRAARELSEQALALFGLQFLGADQDEMESYCSDALARAAEIQQSGESGTVGDLPGQLARLCAFLTGRGPADGLPRQWSTIISAANRTDGAQQHLDISAVLPPVDDIVVQVDSLASEPESWRVYLRAEPGWWRYNADRDRQWALMSVHGEDDVGGLYLSQWGGSSGDGHYQELALVFRPRLNPLARTLILTFTHETDEVTVEVRLP